MCVVLLSIQPTTIPQATPVPPIATTTNLTMKPPPTPLMPILMPTMSVPLIRFRSFRPQSHPLTNPQPHPPHNYRYHYKHHMELRLSWIV
ncbi:hypothetical protein G6F36_015987 [Rhizopus arrhizus]|nr:hypothetical protein G6F36_015987 [Rhizopus arrhizus]